MQLFLTAFESVPRSQSRELPARSHRSAAQAERAENCESPGRLALEPTPDVSRGFFTGGFRTPARLPSCMLSDGAGIRNPPHKPSFFADIMHPKVVLGAQPEE
jgi:hypothetical protein